jgi:TPR repeat protein
MKKVLFAVCCLLSSNMFVALDLRGTEYKRRSDWESNKLAADRGDAKEQVAHGINLKYGRGVAQNLEEAARYLRLAAEQGNALGQYSFGLCLIDGCGVAKNLKEAARYLSLADKQGHPYAKEALQKLNVPRK